MCQVGARPPSTNAVAKAALTPEPSSLKEKCLGAFKCLLLTSKFKFLHWLRVSGGPCHG